MEAGDDYDAIFLKLEEYSVGKAPYSGTATAIPIDGEIWLSSYNGDRVAYGPIPR